MEEGINFILGKYLFHLPSSLNDKFGEIDGLDLKPGQRLVCPLNDLFLQFLLPFRFIDLSIGFA